MNFGFFYSLVLFTLAATFSAYGDRDAPPEIFQVSKASKNKSELLQVFENVQRLEAKKEGKVLNYYVSQRLGPQKFLVYKMKWSGGTVTSSLGSVGGGGGSYSYGGYVPDRSKTYLLETKTDRNVADGEKLTDIISAQSDEIFGYTATTGAKKSVRIIRELKSDEQSLLTKEQFVERLKTGETWLLRGFKKEKCLDCFGDGKLSALQGGGTCKSCRGSGDIKTNYLVKW